VAGSCEYGEDPSGSGATELVSLAKMSVCPINTATYSGFSIHDGT
jgi:hypothetical protein